MKQIKTVDAIGHVLCHDLTRIIPGVTKDAVFRKGHVIEDKDIPILLSIGKDNLYVWEKREGMLHEDEAAEILAKICLNKIIGTKPVKEGKIELYAEADGLFKVDVKRLNKINALGEMMIATRHSNTAVRKGDILAGTRIIPLVIEKEKMDIAQKIAGNKPLLQIKPFSRKKVGIVTTGNEVFHGRIKDSFGPVVKEKLNEYGVQVLNQAIVGDNPEDIRSSIEGFIFQGADLVVCTGGMSVDPDDRTPTAIRLTGADIVTYGAPVLPGAMFLLAYYPIAKKTVPILGLPGCVMYAQRTIFDLVLPRIMADELLAKEDLYGLGHGGLCLNCPNCVFPNCGFGK